MPAQTLREAYAAWGEVINHYLREPTDEEIDKLMPLDHPLPLDEMTVGDYLDFKKTLWQSKQVREIIGLLRKETAYARRNEHHQTSKLFTNAELASISPATKAALKRRFAELNETIKGSFKWQL